METRSNSCGFGPNWEIGRARVVIDAPTWTGVLSEAKGYKRIGSAQTMRARITLGEPGVARRRPVGICKWKP